MKLQIISLIVTAGSLIVTATNTAVTLYVIVIRALRERIVSTRPSEESRQKRLSAWVKGVGKIQTSTIAIVLLFLLISVVVAAFVNTTKLKEPEYTTVLFDAKQAEGDTFPSGMCNIILEGWQDENNYATLCLWTKEGRTDEGCTKLSRVTAEDAWLPLEKESLYKERYLKLDWSQAGEPRCAVQFYGRKLPKEEANRQILLPSKHYNILIIARMEPSQDSTLGKVFLNALGENYNPKRAKYMLELNPHEERFDTINIPLYTWWETSTSQSQRQDVQPQVVGLENITFILEGKGKIFIERLEFKERK